MLNQVNALAKMSYSSESILMSIIDTILKDEKNKWSLAGSNR